MINKSTRVAAVATGAVLAFGLSAPSSFAAPHVHAAHVHAAHVHGAHAHGKAAAAAARHVARVAVQVAREAARKERALQRFTADARFTGIAADQKATVQGNAQADHDALAALAGDAAAASTLADVRTVAAKVRAYRPVGYVVLENELRGAAALQAQADALAATDPTSTTPAQVAALLQPAVDTALGYHSSDAWSTLRQVQQDLNGAAALLPASTGTAS